MPLKAAEKRRAVRSLVLTLVTCPACGGEVDMWSADEETRCLSCDQRIFKKQRASH
jgi:DNA-directed RNA polymerase subunit RPC12/RpoP